MARRYPYLAVIAAFVFSLAVSVAPAAAQNGACPPGTYLLGSPSGTYPDDTIMCAHNLYMVSLVVEHPDNWPCGQFIRHRNPAAPPLPDTGQNPVVIVPSATNYLGQRLRVRFYIFTQPKIAGTAIFSPGHEIDDVTLYIRYYNSDGLLYSIHSAELGSYTKINTYMYDGPFNDYYPVYIVDQVMLASGYGGYLSVRMDYGDSYQHHHNWALSALQVGNEYDYFPEQCPIPNANNPGPTPPPPATWTPLPTWTPNATATAPPPVTTPYPTAPGSTPQATWTVTPIVFPTTRAESTPTPWLPVALPTVNWPTPLPTIILADSGGGGDPDDLGLDGLVSTINDSWQPAMAAVDDWADPNSAAATGNVTPLETAAEMALHVTRPISYIKAIPEFMPNAGPYILYLLMLAGFVAFNIMSRFALSLSARILEIVRRILELIPGM